MPHKRAKRTVREKQRSQQGTDMAPEKLPLSKEAIPKSFSRVINAFVIREQYREKKRKLAEDGDASLTGKRRKLTVDKDDHAQRADGKMKGKQVKSDHKIKPGESIQHFNRRVEDDMRPLIKAAMQSSNAVARKALNAELEAKSEKKRQKHNIKALPDQGEKTGLLNKSNPSSLPVAAVSGGVSPHKEFAEHSSSAPRRLNDIAQAPPEFKKLPRGAAAVHGGIGSGKREGVLSMAQKSMMEQEREKVILRYREMKAQRKGTIDARDRGAAAEE